MKKHLFVLMALCFWSALAAAAVDLNSASVTELQAVPGITPARAKAIVRYRKKHDFSNVDDLRHVKGFSKPTIEKLREEVFVGNPPSSQISQGGGRAHKK